MSFQDIPVEIWTYIFCLSTEYRQSNTLSTSSSFSPRFNTFSAIRQTLHRDELRRALDPVWEMKFTLPLVCKLWREISSPMTYEQVYVGQHATSLLEALQRSETSSPGRGIGRQVQRVVFNYFGLEPPPPPLSLLEVLRWCPNVAYLTKEDADLTPPSLPSHSITEAISFTSIQRFDWAFFQRMLYSRERRVKDMHGLDFLRTVITRAPELQYLRIAVTFPNFRTLSTLSYHIKATSLTTLRVEHIGLIRGELEQWEFPNLNTIVTDSSLTRGTFSPLFGPGIRVVEFLRDESLLSDALRVLEKCPNLRELVYYVQYASIVQPGFVHGELETIRLHSVRNRMLGDAEIADIVQPQFLSILNGVYPSLRRIIFHGAVEGWKDMASLVPGFEKVCDEIRHRQLCTLEDEFGNPFLLN
ncbi:hypothetical protein H0H93_014911 [Arthromyces matolae]|nr:hypothetical protein H0H93_014911 [Arthromyces matolae]